jgi:uncharacterized protein YjiS (DUF1127 family)
MLYQPEKTGPARTARTAVRLIAAVWARLARECADRSALEGMSPEQLADLGLRRTGQRGYRAMDLEERASGRP